MFTVVLVNQILAVNLIRNRFNQCRPPFHCHVEFKALAPVFRFQETQTVCTKSICHRYISCTQGAHRPSLESLSDCGLADALARGSLQAQGASHTLPNLDEQGHFTGGCFSGVARRGFWEV